MTDREFRTAKSARTFESILEAATRLFMEQGFYQTTMRDLAKACGMGLGALYYYVQSKEELVLRFYERVNQQVGSTFRATQDLPDDLPGSFALFLRLKLDALTPYRELLRVVIKEAVDPESPLCPLSPASTSTLDLSLGLLLELVERTGAGEGDGAARLARGLWLIHMGVLGYWLHDRSEGHAATFAAIDVLAGALRFIPMLRQMSGLEGLDGQLELLLAGIFAPMNA